MRPTMFKDHHWLSNPKNVMLLELQEKAYIDAAVVPSPIQPPPAKRHHAGLRLPAIPPLPAS